MARKATKQAHRGVMIASHLETGLHRAVKASAKANGRTLQGELNHRLKLSIAADKAAKRSAMQAAE
jgi:hypothetical protein